MPEPTPIKISAVTEALDLTPDSQFIGVVGGNSRRFSMQSLLSSAAAESYRNNGVIGNALVPFGSLIEFPAAMRGGLPYGWWVYSDDGGDTFKACNWSPEALRIGSTDVRDLSFIDPEHVFTDAAGTIKALYGQTLGAYKDSRGRIIATQATSAARPTYGRHPASGIRNLLRNNTTDGAVLGVIGSGGAMPTWWNAAFFGGNSAGTVEVVAIGADYVDLLIDQTGSTGAASIGFNTNSLPTTTGSERSLGVNVALVSGAVGGAVELRVSLRDENDQGITSEVMGATLTLTGTLQRFERSRTVTSLQGVQARHDLRFSGGPWTGIVRVGLPQVEMGLTSTALQIARTSGFDVTETGQRSVYYLKPDGVDDWMALASAFAPAGAYTVAAAHDHPDSVSNVIIGRASSGTNARLIRSSNNALVFRASGTINRTDFSSGAFSAVSTGRAVALVRVANAGVADGWMSAIGPLSGTLTGDMVPMQAGGLDALFRGNTEYGVGRFYGGVLIDRAITEPERLMLQLYLASKGGITL